jgi:hypothetical protein
MDLAEGVADAVVAVVEGVGDVVTLVDRSPHGVVGGDGEPSPLRTPVSTTCRSLPSGLTDMITAQGGVMVLSSGLALEELLTLK